MSNNIAGESLRLVYGLPSVPPAGPVLTRSISVSGSAGALTILDGTPGGDTILLRAGDGAAFGNAGDDRITFSGGSSVGTAEIAVGGLGADTFIFTPGKTIAPALAGQISDFSTAEGDKLDLSQLTDNFSAVRIDTTGPDAASVEVAGVRFVVTGVDVRLDQSNVIVRAGGTTSGGGITPAGATEAADVMTGTAADDVLAGLGGDDVISGGEGNDVLNGNAGNDSVAGGPGGDTVYGGQGNDSLNGNVGADLLFGNLGQDAVFGGQSDDTIYGGQGNDWVNGNLGADRAFGDVGDDTVYGGQGGDWLAGGAGNDLLSGDLGDDTLTGGDGADRFAFGSGTGTDVITDFVPGTEIIAFASGVFDSVAAILAGLTVTGGNAVIGFAGGQVTVTGVGSLTAADFSMT